MDHLITNRVWEQVAKIVGDERKTAAIAYVSRNAPLYFGCGDVLVCDASERAVKCGETDARILIKFHKAGAELYSADNLHAKVLLSENLAVIGSANLSGQAGTSLREACIVTSRAHVISQVSALIHAIKRSAVRIDEPFLQRISRLKVNRRSRMILHSKKRAIEIGNRFWVVNTSPLEISVEEEAWVKEGEAETHRILGKPRVQLDWMRWTGNSRFRRLARSGDTVLEIWKPNHEALVVRPRGILHRQDHQKWTRFYLKYVPESKMIPWNRLKNALQRHGLKSISPRSIRELTPGQIYQIEACFLDRI